MFWASSQDFNNQVVKPVKEFFTDTVPDALSSAWSWLTGGSSASEDPSQVVNPVHVVGGALSGVDNFFTGDRDYARQREFNDINNAFAANEAEKAWKRSEQSALNAFERQKELAQNEYSYRIADLRKNGINPYVALGQSASVPGTPSGSAYSASPSGASSQNSSAGLSSLLSMLFGSAFRMAMSMRELSSREDIARDELFMRANQKPADYTDTYLNKYGQVKGYRTRSY